ncbi:exonuclease SbcCD subunit D C-terminal domain-containing protein [Neolewinella litorea]|uniref:Nuclease SbcCD subunit D n=1 Tax=Neolewinella litorea TaxID=2562452 RepID=A0A4S4NKY6_9BACT|nr:exonuclease SbcCD subunit D C-terminal domain-containing protein [Neolewinella litorea]THH40576.1 exonuclease subunit SbcD [Neolewinella litorea]
MRILHTADWHLGHRLYNRDRTPEHRAALDWLLQTVESEAVDVVIIAGDVFDVTNPSNQAKELYYEFLARLVKTRCASAVIVGGNHDSASLLDAPRGLLKALQLHVVGSAHTEAHDRVLKIRCGEEEVLVAAVPYLRERDLRTARFGEGSTDRLQALREGIRRHFTEIAEAAETLRSDPSVPLIATGHLFAAGATDDDEKKSYIYQADENNIEAGHFPACFDYVALGHVHRAQHVGEYAHIRYAGSLVPLTFVEGQAARSVCLVDLDRAGKPVHCRKIKVPAARTLLRLHAEFPDVKEALRRAVQALEAPSLTPWVEVRVRTDVPIPNMREKLYDVIREAGTAADGPPAVDILRISTERLTVRDAATPADDPRQLDELQPTDVFDQLCERQQLPADHSAVLQQDFRELFSWVSEQDDL